MNFNFGEVLTKAWQIIWKHKILWIFGILASCGRSGSFNSNNRIEQNNGANFNMPPRMLELTRWIENHVWQFVAIVLAVVCVIWIITTFLSTIGKIGLIRGAAQADGGVEQLVFGQLFSESMPYFWRIFWLGVILALPILLTVLPLALVGVAAATSSGISNNPLAAIGIVPLLLGCICLLFPVMIVLGMILSQAERAAVLEDLGVMPALSRGWEVFRNNLGPIIIMAIILGVIGFVIGLVLLVPVFVIVLPAAIAYMAGNSQNYTPLILAGLCFCLYLPVMWLLQGAVTAYAESAWTLTFLRLTAKPGNTVTSTPEPTPPSDSDKTLLAPPHA